MEYLRKRGYLVGKTEHWQKIWNPRPGGPPGVRVDLFGILDAIAIGPEDAAAMHTVGLQATSGANTGSHIQKAMECPALPIWLRSGNVFQLQAWRKGGARGERKLWKVRIIEFYWTSNGIIYEELKQEDPNVKVAGIS